MNTHKIYGLVCPIDNTIKYVGATKHKLSHRLSQHLSDSNSKNSKKAVWIRGLRQQDLNVSIVLLEEVSTEEWKDKERYYISKFREITPDMKNTCDGFGHLPKGLFKHTEEFKKSKSEFMTKRNQEHPLSAEFYDKLAEGKRKKIIQSTKTGEFIAEFNSVAEAAKMFLGIQKDGSLTKAANAISNQLNGRSLSAFGFVWSYKK